MKATCIITNCRKVAPAGEPFCSVHRDKPRPKIEEIELRARSNIEAMHAHNDVFPGELVNTKVGNLAQEAARMAFEKFEAGLRKAITDAFEQGQDYIFTYVQPPAPHPTKFEIVWHIHGYAVEAGTVDPANLSPGHRLFRLVDWRDRI